MEIKKNSHGCEYVEIKTTNGTIVVYDGAWGQKEGSGAEIYYKPNGCKKEYRCSVIDDNVQNEDDDCNETSLGIYAFGNPWDDEEDNVQETKIKLKHISDYLKDDDDDDDNVKCPHCNVTNPRALWNYETERVFGGNITPLPDVSNMEWLDYICPCCHDKISIKEIFDKNKNIR